MKFLRFERLLVTAFGRIENGRLACHLNHLLRTSYRKRKRKSQCLARSQRDLHFDFGETLRLGTDLILTGG